MTDNTYIIFASDHGEMLGDHGLYTKSVPYESAMHVPLIIAGPNIEGGRTCNALVELIDLNPTICDMADVEPHRNLDARSLFPLLTGASDDHRTEIISLLNNFSVVRDDQHKLIQHDNDMNELYDLQSDPGEQRNLIEELPEVAKRLNSRFKARLKEGAWHR